MISEDTGFSLEEVKEIISLPDWKISNVYLYGSRVYGNFDHASDYDFLVVARSMDRDREIRFSKYNIHVHTPDKFEDDLRAYRMVNLECVFAPSFAKAQEKVDYRTKLSMDDFKLKKSIFKQSHDSWLKSNMKFREMDIDRAVKSLFHSLRILMFGIQIIKYGEITNFSEANGYWDEISKMEEFKWNIFKNRFLPIKKELEEELMDVKEQI